LNPRLPFLTRRRLFALLGSGAALSAGPAGAQAPGADWAAVVAAARGQTVHFNAWAGSEQINAYIQ
jgi:putative thiamine transport system substrate-binding protein